MRDQVGPGTAAIVNDVEKQLAASESIPSLTEFLRLGELAGELQIASPDGLSVGWSSHCLQTRSEE